MKRQLLILFVVSTSILYSCGNKEYNSNTPQDIMENPNTVSPHPSPIVNTGKSPEEAYEMLHVVFEGKPELESIKKLLSAVMAKYKIEENYENLNRCGSALIAMKNSSAVGVTEMEVLKHMYQHGNINQTFPNQVAISATILEQTR